VKISVLVNYHCALGNTNKQSVLLKVMFYGMSDGFAGRGILKEEGGKRLTPSSTIVGLRTLCE
jgi:hypothetical protein